MSSWFLLLVFPQGALRAQEAPLRLAILDLAGDDGGRIAALLRGEARRDAGLELVDEGLARGATTSAAFPNLLNLSREEARGLGQGIGCDFLVCGKVLVTKRLAAGETFFFDALAGLYWVEARTGRLVRFAFERETAPDEARARQALDARLRRQWDGYLDTLRAARRAHADEAARVASAAPARAVLIDDQAPAGLNGPVFYQRLKPAYPESADLADIAATVELEAEFGADGRVGDVVVTRWAGFGLEDAALDTVRKLTFKPAELNGKPVTIRGLVRYTFRRPQAQAPRPADPGDIERLKRSLRNLKNTGPIPDPPRNF